MARTRLEQQMYDQGATDARDGRPSTPPTMGGAAATAYEAGYASVAAATKPSPPDGRKPSSGSRAKPSRRPAKTTARGARGATGRRRRSTTARRAGRQVRLPGRGRVTNLVSAVGAGVALAVLYNALTHADAVAGALAGPTKALQWLDDPTKSIPYRPGS